MAVTFSMEERNEAHALWFNHNRFSIPLLHDWVNRDHTDNMHYKFEKKIAEDVKEIFQSEVAMASLGNAPEWDIKYHSGATIEIKATSWVGNLYNDSGDDPGNNCFVETGSYFGAELRDSGLTTTEADAYVFLQPALYNQKWTVKVRVIPTQILLDIQNSTKGKRIGDSFGFSIRWREIINDGFIGTYPYNFETEVIDLSSFHKWSGGIPKIRERLQHIKG